MRARRPVATGPKIHAAYLDMARQRREIAEQAEVLDRRITSSETGGSSSTRALAMVHSFDRIVIVSACIGVRVAWAKRLRPAGGAIGFPMPVVRLRTSTQLETTTFIAYVMAVARWASGEPRARIPVRRFLARPFYRADT